MPSETSRTQEGPQIHLTLSFFHLYENHHKGVVPVSLPPCGRALCWAMGCHWRCGCQPWARTPAQPPCTENSSRNQQQAAFISSLPEAPPQHTVMGRVLLKPISLAYLKCETTEAKQQLPVIRVNKQGKVLDQAAPALALSPGQQVPGLPGPAWPQELPWGRRIPA